MDNIELGHKTIRLLYDEFPNYFRNGDILIAGSFYYKKIGCNIIPEYKDVDLIIDENKDYIVHDILDTMKSKYNTKGFRNTFDECGLIGACIIDGYAPVDLLRNDFSDKLPPFEIIDGVWSYRLSHKVLFETYKKLESKNYQPRYKIIKEFFESLL